MTEGIKTPTVERRIDNLRRIASDESVNAFARSICLEAAEYIALLTQERDALRNALEEIADETPWGGPAENHVKYLRDTAIRALKTEGT